MSSFSRNTAGDSTADGILDALDAINTKMTAMNTEADSDRALIIARLEAIEARLNAGIQVQVVTSL